MKQILALCDLDDSLVAAGSEHKPGYKPVCFHEGSAVTFMSPAQQVLYAMLRQTTRLIPCTGRTVNSFRTIQLDFDDYVICSFGGMILDPQGMPVPGWQEHIKAAAAAAEQELRRIYQEVHAMFSPHYPSFRFALREDGGNLLYINIKDSSREEDMNLLPWQIEGIVPEADGWWMHVNGRNLAICPPFLGKKHAVSWLLENLIPEAERQCVLALGDSFSDLPFMGLANFAIMPSESQAFRRFQ